MTDLMELASRVEAREGPDRELDALIGVAVAGYFLGEPRYPGAERRYGYVDKEGCRVEPGNGAADRLIPLYTASLDAAMTLVPGELRTAMVQKPDTTWGCALLALASDNREFPESTAPTPALALTAAALRARAHQGATHVDQ